MHACLTFASGQVFLCVCLRCGKRKTCAVSLHAWHEVCCVRIIRRFWHVQVCTSFVVVGVCKLAHHSSYLACASLHIIHCCWRVQICTSFVVVGVGQFAHHSLLLDVLLVCNACNAICNTNSYHHICIIIIKLTCLIFLLAPGQMNMQMPLVELISWE